ncbi:MAG: hypothetical protein D4R65_04055 [Verrucomicrobiaceae bacterium]|nr:MAG: hypothetical protein D4R65_04055 [Verrucomicrobiaceae bacterium]
MRTKDHRPFAKNIVSASRRGGASAGLLFFLGLFAVLTLVGLVWISQPVSNQELLANFAKARDFLVAAHSVGGLPWWSPMFMQGTSLAPSWSFMVTNVVMWAFSIPLGWFIGPKVAVLAVMAFGACGTFLFVRRYADDEWAGALAGFLFLLCPSLLTRAAGYEHFVVLCSMALLPWAFRAVSGFFRSPGIGTAIGAAAAYAAVVMAYGKTGLMALPAMGVFALAEYFNQPRERRPGLLPVLWVAGAFLLLAVVPNLPALRESGFVAMFEFGPFEGWQRAFSTKSAFGWVDRGGMLTEGIDSAYSPTTGNGGTYLGIGVFVIFVTALFRGTFHESGAGRKARLFFVLALFTFWLSFGPKGVLGGHMQFLALSSGAPDFAPALGWFFLAAQVWMIFRLVPPGWPLRGIIASAIAFIYLFVPGFRLFELLPIYKNIRAPFDFFQVTGAVCAVVAAAIAGRLLNAQMRVGALKSGLIAAMLCLVVLDVAPYAKPFFKGPMEREVFDDFLSAQEFLKSSPVPGRVYPFSGRYFYLLTPMLSGRPLVAEAFNNYLQQRGAAILQGTAFFSDENLASYLDISGVSHVLVDKTDPDTPKELQERLRKLLHPAYENKNFVVLENKGSLGEGFFAKDFLAATDSSPGVGAGALEGARFHMAVIELTGVATDEPGLGGKVAGGRIEPMNDGQAVQEGSPFSRVKNSTKGSYQKVAFEPTGSSGWLVMNQAWHPDWRAYGHDGAALPIHRAFLAFSAVKTDGVSGVEFRFEQPWWYNICAGVGILSWVGALSLILFSRWLSICSRPHLFHD